MNGKVFVGIVFVLLAFVIVFVIFSGKLDITGNVINNGIEYEVERVVFKGADERDVHGLFYRPSKEQFDVVIVLPGAGGTKESRGYYGEMFKEKGVGTLILDQRGIGDTGGDVPSFADELYSYFGGENSFQMLMAMDVSSSINFLKENEGVDEFVVLGESMGGRYTIIAGAFDQRIAGLIVISSAGYFSSAGNEVADRYLEYINPNTYISQLNGKRVLMLHAREDNVIPIEDARKTFDFAKEPKRFVEVDGENCVHGYCEEMRDYIFEELDEVFG